MTLETSIKWSSDIGLHWDNIKNLGVTDDLKVKCSSTNWTSWTEKVILTPFRRDIYQAFGDLFDKQVLDNQVKLLNVRENGDRVIR